MVWGQRGTCTVVPCLSIPEDVKYSNILLDGVVEWGIVECGGCEYGIWESVVERRSTCYCIESTCQMFSLTVQLPVCIVIAPIHSSNSTTSTPWGGYSPAAEAQELSL